MTEDQQTPTPAERPAPTEPPAAPPQPVTGAQPSATPQPEAEAQPAAVEPQPAAEPAPRRQLPKPVALTLVGIMFLAFVVFLVFGYRAFDARLSGAKQLDRATVLLGEADNVVVDIDEVVRAQVTSELASQAKEQAAAVPGAQAQLEEVVSLVEQARPSLTDDEQEKADLVRKAAEARLAMLAPAPAILKANEQAASAMGPADEAWTIVLTADTRSDEAVKQYNKLTKAGVTQSKKLNLRVESELKEARTKFELAEAAFPDAPFETYLAYVEARLKLNTLSQQSDAAWLANDVEKANSIINTYNAEDKAAVALAKTLPATPDEAIATTFETVTDKVSDEYYAARDAATKADQALRDY